MDIKIIYEDSDLLAIDKPSGVTVNRSDTTKNEETVQDWTETKFSIFNFQFSIDKESDFYKRGGIVHRLDKETSGILLIAKNPASFLNLQKQFKDRGVKKTYIALVHGEVKPESGEINVPVGRLSFNRKRFGVVAGGREAVTKYKVLSIKYYVSDGKKEPLSLLELYPKTGRTHQIRVHLKYFGHPVFSDPLYGGRKTSRKDRKVLPRLFLHASEISFLHPKDGREIFLQSKLPKGLEEFTKSLSPRID